MCPFHPVCAASHVSALSSINCELLLLLLLHTHAHTYSNYHHYYTHTLVYLPQQLTQSIGPQSTPTLYQRSWQVRGTCPPPCEAPGHLEVPLTMTMAVSGPERTSHVSSTCREPGGPGSGTRLTAVFCRLHCLLLTSLFTAAFTAAFTRTGIVVITSVS